MLKSNFISSRTKKPKRFHSKVETQPKFHVGLKLSFDEVKRPESFSTASYSKSYMAQSSTLPWKRGTRGLHTYECNP